MDELGKNLSLMSSIVIAVILFFGYFIQKKRLLEMFTIAVSLAVAAIPEGLPVVVTVTLALGVLRLADRKAIMKKMPSIETLASTTVICVDKTGTLTQNKMTVQHIFTSNMAQPLSVVDLKEHGQFSKSIHDLIICANICNQAHVDREGNILGQSTDCSLLDLVLRQLNMNDFRSQGENGVEIPFSSDRKFMLREWNLPHVKYNVFVKGALSVLLDSCELVMDGVSLDEATRRNIVHMATMLSSYGLRVIALAAGYSSPKGYSSESPPQGLTFLGLVSIHDPPRDGVSDAISQLQSCGVRMIMLTGDSRETAEAVGKQVGLYSGDSISGLDLQGAHGLERLERVSICYRMTPSHKLSVIRKLQDLGHIVAMTGDGVNDAPALRLADIGISMGASGTDVSKEAADMILVNDDLTTLVSAIEEGTIYLGHITRLRDRQYSMLTNNKFQRKIDIFQYSKFFKFPAVNKCISINFSCRFYHAWSSKSFKCNANSVD
jgi:Ca2+-transporting ATPase